MIFYATQISLLVNRRLTVGFSQNLKAYSFQTIYRCQFKFRKKKAKPGFLLLLNRPKKRSSVLSLTHVLERSKNFRKNRNVKVGTTSFSKLLFYFKKLLERYSTFAESVLKYCVFGESKGKKGRSNEKAKCKTVFGINSNNTKEYFLQKIKKACKFFSERLSAYKASATKTVGLGLILRWVKLV